MELSQRVNKKFYFRLLFFFWITGDVFRNDVGYFMIQRELNRPIYRQARLELLILAIFNAFWLYQGWIFKYFILLYVTQFWAKWAITTINLLQHDGCEMQSKEGSGKYNNSRNFSGSILNWWCLNNGYHGLHHMYPAMHWSQLKEKHEELLQPYNHPNLNIESILG
jgi:fatty acid desaturase